MTRKIIQNSVHCLLCNEDIYSSHRHDFRTCSGGHVSVDGGLAYMRRSYEKNAAFVDTSMTMEEEAVNDIMEAVKWGKETGRNDFGIALAVIRALRKHRLLDMTKFEGEYDE